MSPSGQLSAQTLWRISNHGDLEGLGGERSDGRWHTAERSRRIVYLSENAATALIEALANLKGNPALFPESYQLMRVEVASSVSRLTVEDLPGVSLVENWRESLAETQAAGNAWLAGMGSALLQVPSAPAPESRNWLLNPLHADARGVRVESVRRIAYDKRLFRVGPVNAGPGR